MAKHKVFWESIYHMVKYGKAQELQFKQKRRYECKGNGLKGPHLSL